MALWGLIVACLAALALFQITPRVWNESGDRGGRLREATLVFEHGGPLLVGRAHGATGAYTSVELGDDEGEFVYLPVLSRLFGVSDPRAMWRYLYIALVTLTTAVYPAIFYRLTTSLLAGLAAPLIFLVCIISMGFLEMYWVPAWGALTLLPFMYLMAREWPRFGLAAVAAIALVAGWMSTMRADCGLGIAIAAAILLIMRRWRWWRLLPALALVALLYISIGTFVFGAIRANRDHRIGNAAAKRINVSTSHSLWHEVYAGVGYLPNSYGLRYEDEVPDELAAREAPNASAFTSRWEAVLRDAFFRFVVDHPLEVIRQYAAKVIVTLADTAPYLLFVLLTLPAMLLSGADRRNARRWILLTLPVAIVAFLPTMVAVPMESYEQGLYGAIGALDVLGLCWLLKWLESAVRERGGIRSTLDAVTVRASWRALGDGTTPGWRSARISIAATAVLFALSFGGYFVRRDAAPSEGTPSGVLMEGYPFRS
jgi:hypothetical protein